MSTRQLEQVEQDYKAFAPEGAKVVQVVQSHGPSYEERRAGVACAVCGWDWPTKRITWMLPTKSPLGYIQALVCRNGVRCRARVTPPA